MCNLFPVGLGWDWVMVPSITILPYHLAIVFLVEFHYHLNREMYWKLQVQTKSKHVKRMSRETSK